QANGLATLWLVYVSLGVLGTGLAYIGVVALMVIWFPQQRGFGAGAVAAGYGLGAIIATIPIALSLTTNRLQHTSPNVGILFAL
ncbi:oxalate/formate MFS antiporter, partial [Klebsiella pneumoniae]|nr:oxalate/formate MFS antiporter [Klebsiella pneumoniae]